MNVQMVYKTVQNYILEKKKYILGIWLKMYVQNGIRLGL